MVHEFTPELKKTLEHATQLADRVKTQFNTECACLAQTWVAYLAEYVYASARAVEALKAGEKTLAAKNRLDATCHRARAERKQKELRRAIERYTDGTSE